jgi:hypothetical protein
VELHAALKAPLFQVTARVRGNLPSAAEAAAEKWDNYRSGRPLRHPKSKAQSKAQFKGVGQECQTNTGKIEGMSVPHESKSALALYARNFLNGPQ